MGFRWTITPSSAFMKLYTSYEQRVYMAIMALLDRRAPEIQNWMKENRPWQDRTGNARASLTAQVIPELRRILIELSLGRMPNGVNLEYGVYLEYANGGKYAIIGPAIDYWAPILLDDLRKLLNA